MKSLLIVSLVVMMFSCSTIENHKVNSEREIASQSFAQSCTKENRSKGLKTFINSCLSQISTNKYERVKDLFSLVRNNTLYTISNPGAMRYISTLNFNLRNAPELDLYFTDEHIWKIGDIRTLSGNTDAKWKSVQWGCSGVESTFNNKKISETEHPQDLFYSQAKESDFAGLDAMTFAFLNINDEGMRKLSREDLIKYSKRKMGRKAKRNNKMLQLFDKFSSEGNLFKIVSKSGYFTMYLLQRPTFEFDEDGRPTHRWEIVLIDNADCSA